MTPTPNNEALAALENLLAYVRGKDDLYANGAIRQLAEEAVSALASSGQAAPNKEARAKAAVKQALDALMVGNVKKAIPVLDTLHDYLSLPGASGQAASAVPLPRLSGAFRTTVADGDRYAMVFQFQTLADLQAADQEWLDAKHLRPEVAAMGGQQPEESARAGTDIGQPVLGAGPALCTPSEAAELAGRFKLPVRFELGDEALREDCERLARMIDHVRAPAEPMWPIRGVRVDGDKVIVLAKGGNDAARWLCGEILARLKR